MSESERNEANPDEHSPGHQLIQEAIAEKQIADAIEEAVGTPASIEEAQLLEAAELLEVELPEEGD